MKVKCDLCRKEIEESECSNYYKNGNICLKCEKELDRYGCN